MSPFVLPKLPSRVYVRFGEAISLGGLNRRDKVACQESYERVKVCNDANPQTRRLYVYEVRPETRSIV